MITQRGEKHYSIHKAYIMNVAFISDYVTLHLCFCQILTQIVLLGSIWAHCHRCHWDFLGTHLHLHLLNSFCIMCSHFVCSFWLVHFFDFTARFICQWDQYALSNLSHDCLWPHWGKCTWTWNMLYLIDMCFSMLWLKNKSSLCSAWCKMLCMTIHFYIVANF